MKPVLWLGLALACGGAVAVSWVPEDDLVVAASRPAPPAGNTGVSASAAAAVAVTTPAPAIQPVDAPRPAARDAWPALGATARAAWAAPAKPPPPAPTPLPPAPPALPPPFPYQWLGQMQEGAQLRFFLSGPQQTVAVSAGDVVDERWRVEGRDAGRLRLTWLPTGVTVHVSPRGPSLSNLDPT